MPVVDVWSKMASRLRIFIALYLVATLLGQICTSYNIDNLKRSGGKFLLLMKTLYKFHMAVLSAFICYGQLVINCK